MTEGADGGTSSDVSWGIVLLSVVDGYRGPRAWFCVVDAAFQVLLGVAGAAAEFTVDRGLGSCAATAWATVAVAAAYVAALIVARPHRTRAQWYTVVLANGLVLAIAFAMALVVQRAWADRVMPDYTTLLGLAAAAQCLAFVQAIQELTLQIVDLIAAWRGGSLWRLLLRPQLRRREALRAFSRPVAASTDHVPQLSLPSPGGGGLLPDHEMPRHSIMFPAPIPPEMHPSRVDHPITSLRSDGRQIAPDVPASSSLYAAFVDDDSTGTTISETDSILDQRERIMRLLI
jgi:hypothetical protein